MDEQILQFSSITQASTETAKHYLEIADGKLEMAMQLFWESGGEDVAGLSRREAETVRDPALDPAPGDTSSVTAEQDGEGEEEGEKEDDEALAHRLQREEEEARDSRVRRSEERRNKESAPPAEKEHRAPIAAHQDVLIGGETGESYGSMDLDHSTFNDLLAGRSTTDTSIFGSNPTRPTPFSASHPARHVEEEEDEETRRRTSRLEELFRPPTELILPGRATLDRAREVAKSEEKWILINVQDLSNFQCQILNRDVWKDPEMVELVQENFVFLQYIKGSREAVEYERFYQITGEPHVAILDPLTGERLREWNFPLTLTQYLIEFESFMASEITEDEEGKEGSSAGRGSKGKQRAEGDDVNNPLILDNNTPPSPSSSGKRKAFSDMTEDEMLEAALAASAKEAGLDSPPLREEAATSSKALLLDRKEAVPVSMPVEPPAGPDATRVQFRLPDGSRVVRRFLKTDPVRYLFHFIQLSYPDMEDFEIIAVREALSEEMDRSLEEKQLLNAALTVHPN
ncbi:hypothetical protein BJ684DRAFT_20984 [Piptocephalis cylindrospora]|uniref:UBX domain-containing protein n=1 Tax=Piptocephalis cylindrospora TaxID=1907219 RepID=A0A4P9Y309_9FUNG|nr:hypothetical protein BJ684DRAFT_20984 [Piptocephalis cylindrospora]|eukprot:RKP12481.1 hypothetical protein BJ684DRAFT_20984 [Piptocephalis cylindrospora]